VVPAVLIVLLACLAALQVAGLQLRLQDASADAARALSRGDPQSSIATRLEQVVPGATLTVEHRGDAVCAVLVAAPPGGVAALAGVNVRASGCALNGGL
jgi:Flp pilus assembly protein TadG